MNRVLKIIDKVISIWLIFLMAVLTVGVIMSVILRYVFNISFVQAEEAITMVFVATTYFATALGIREKEHIGIHYFADKASPMLRKFIDVLVNLVIISVTCFVFTQSLKWIGKVGSVLTPSMQIPKIYFYSIVPISCVILVFYSLVDILSVFVKVEPADPGYEKNEIADPVCEPEFPKEVTETPAGSNNLYEGVLP